MIDFEDAKIVELVYCGDRCAVCSRLLNPPGAAVSVRHKGPGGPCFLCAACANNAARAARGHINALLKKIAQSIHRRMA